LQVPDVSKIELLGAQGEHIYVEFSTREIAGLGIDRAALIAALRAQNAVGPAGALETGQEKISLRVSGAFRMRVRSSRRRASRMNPQPQPLPRRRGEIDAKRSA
jgi:multidrug efflux pump subunit AcrB